MNAPANGKNGRPEPGSPESLARHKEWLYGKGGTPCRCEHAYISGGRLYGLSMGKSWARTTTHPDCVHHGRKAQAEAKRRQKARAR